MGLGLHSKLGDEYKKEEVQIFFFGGGLYVSQKYTSIITQ